MLNIKASSFSSEENSGITQKQVTKERIHTEDKETFKAELFLLGI